MMFLVQRVDTPDPVRPLLSSGNGTSKFRCAELRDLVSETKLVHDLVLIHGKHGGAHGGAA